MARLKSTERSGQPCRLRLPGHCAGSAIAAAAILLLWPPFASSQTRLRDGNLNAQAAAQLAAAQQAARQKAIQQFRERESFVEYMRAHPELQPVNPYKHKSTDDMYTGDGQEMQTRYGTGDAYWQKESSYWNDQAAYWGQNPNQSAANPNQGPNPGSAVDPNLGANYSNSNYPANYTAPPAPNYTAPPAPNYTAPPAPNYTAPVQRRPSPAVPPDQIYTDINAPNFMPSSLLSPQDVALAKEGKKYMPAGVPKQTIKQALSEMENLLINLHDAGRIGTADIDYLSEQLLGIKRNYAAMLSSPRGLTKRSEDAVWEDLAKLKAEIQKPH